jgi:glyoxylase-like metal-dependent hydrolase (beta-lactamase superfamily II)
VNVKSLPEETIDGIKIIKTPGHTPGHVCFKFNEYLFVGDLINTRDNKVNLMNRKYNSNYQQMINSINNLDISGVKYICPAHGNIIEAEST